MSRSADREYVTSAGCVVTRQQGGVATLLLVWTLDFTNPTLPKGSVEPGETFEQAAVRETREETGYTVSIADRNPVTVTTVLADHPPIVEKTLHFFRATPERGNPELRTERNLISAVRWLPVPEALDAMERPEERRAVTVLLAR